MGMPLIITAPSWKRNGKLIKLNYLLEFINMSKKTYRVTFIDNVTANSEEEAYEALIHYMGQCVKYKDLTCFTFEEAEEEQHQTH